MLNNLLELIMCPVCIDGQMFISLAGTQESYGREFDLDDVDKLKDGIIDKYWIFNCHTCGATQKLNFRDIEKMARKEISNRVLRLKATAELSKGVFVKTKYLVYCGVCTGYDSNGACPQLIYDECKLRRMPRVI